MQQCNLFKFSRAYVPEICRAKKTSINYTVASSWHLTLFHYEDARSNNPQIIVTVIDGKIERK